MLPTRLAVFLTCTLVFTLPGADPQSAPGSATLPSFEAATIKPPDPKARFRKAGFYGEAGGRIFYGGTVKMLVEDAFNLQDYQVTGGPDWSASQWFEINAVPPGTSPSRTIKVANAEPTSEQRLMLENLLCDRFGLKFHFRTREGEVYLLTRSGKPLQLKTPKYPAADPRAIVMIKQGGIADGEAEGTNTTTNYLAVRLSSYLSFPVLNQTGITGSYDYYLPPVNPENNDIVADVLSVVDRLGLKIKRGRAPIQILVIDHVQQPTAN